jgi:hypothetical protein
LIGILRQDSERSPVAHLGFTKAGRNRVASISYNLQSDILVIFTRSTSSPFLSTPARFFYSCLLRVHPVSISIKCFRVVKSPAKEESPNTLYAKERTLSQSSKYNLAKMPPIPVRSVKLGWFSRSLPFCEAPSDIRTFVVILAILSHVRLYLCRSRREAALRRG